MGKEPHAPRGEQTVTHAQISLAGCRTSLEKYYEWSVSAPEDAIHFLVKRLDAQTAHFQSVLKTGRGRQGSRGEPRIIGPPGALGPGEQQREETIKSIEPDFHQIVYGNLIRLMRELESQKGSDDSPTSVIIWFDQSNLTGGTLRLLSLCHS